MGCTEDPQSFWRVIELDQQRISALDTATVAVKGWTLSLSTALVGVAISQNDDRFVLVGMAATALFWTIDHGYRSVQLRHAARVRRLEKLLIPGHAIWTEEPEPSSDGSVHSRPWLRYWSTFMFFGPVVVGLAIAVVLL